VRNAPASGTANRAVRPRRSAGQRLQILLTGDGQPGERLPTRPRCPWLKTWRGSQRPSAASRQSPEVGHLSALVLSLAAVATWGLPGKRVVPTPFGDLEPADAAALTADAADVERFLESK